MGTKVSKIFRLDPAAEADLTEAARRSGMTQTQIVEDALRCYFGLRDTDLDRRQALVTASLTPASARAAAAREAALDAARRLPEWQPKSKADAPSARKRGPRRGAGGD